MDLNNILNNKIYTLEEFKQNVLIFSKEQSENIRKRYIETFINTEKDYYKKRIKILKDCVDGECYKGYLWDCLKNPVVVSFEEMKSNICKLDDVCVMWDIHSKEQIFIEDYWKFDKNDIVNMNSKLLMNNLVYLPEDIYIFDENFGQSYILTHEYDDNHKRWCLKSNGI